MSRYPDPITTENFETAWKYTAGKQRSSIRKAAIRRIPVALAQIVFGCIFFVLAFGVIYETGSPSVRIFLDQIPQVMGWCSKISGTVLEGAPEGTAWIMRCAALLCFAPFFVALAPAVLIFLLYHPAAPKRTGDMREDSWQLWNMAKHAREYTRKTGNDMATVFSVLMGMFTVIFSLGEQSSPDASPMQAVSHGVAVILGYHIVNLPLRLLLKPLHFCYVPKSLVAVTEKYYYTQQKQTEPTEAKKEMPSGEIT